jgi:hypothetical protein
MDLDEKQNEPFFSNNNEITKIIIEAVKDGRLIPYVNDSLTRRMTKETFIEYISFESGIEEDSWGSSGGGTDAWGASSGGTTDAWGSGSSAAAEPGFGATPSGPSMTERFPREFKRLELKEDVFFDKIRSRMYYDIQAVTIIFEDRISGIDKPVGVFAYKDLEKLFRSMPNEAIWYNRQNTAQHRNMADAFLLRLFGARVIRISNPQNLQIEDIYQDQQIALYMSQYLEHKMMEYEHDLWEY